MVRFALLLGAGLLALAALPTHRLPAADSPTSPPSLPADHIGNAADFLQTKRCQELFTWYAKKAPPLSEAEPWPESPDLPPAGPSLVEGPPPKSATVNVKTTAELLAALKAPAPNTTILLADGRYDIADIVNIRHVKNLTIRGASGDRAKVILDGAKSANERILWVEDCDGFRIADLTIQNCLKYGLTFDANLNTQHIRVHNIHFHNCWQRGLKITGLLEDRRGYHPTDVLDDRTKKLRPHDGRVEHCLFTVDHLKRFDDGVDNGDYIAGIDAMWLKDWTIADNIFIGIQGRHTGGRGAVFVWVKSEDVTVERNLFIDCDRSIAFGNPSGAPEHMLRGIIRNNFISCGKNKGIELCRTQDCVVSHNTLLDPTADCSRVIHVMQPTGKATIVDNLLNGTILIDSGEARVAGNLLNAMDTGWFLPGPGNLHLRALAPACSDWHPAPEDLAAAQPQIPLLGFDGALAKGRIYPGADQPAGDLPQLVSGGPRSIEHRAIGENPVAPPPPDLRDAATQPLRAAAVTAIVQLAGGDKPKQAYLCVRYRHQPTSIRLLGADPDAGLQVEIAGEKSTLPWQEIANFDLALILEMLTDDGQKNAADHYVLLAKLYQSTQRAFKAKDMVERALAKDKTAVAKLPAELQPAPAP